jgi:carbon-monoxide dehydrogenase catalytic subunit
MGPCRIDPFGEGPQYGVCGADAEIMVARNLARMIAAGAASHSDHGRDLVEVLYKIGHGKAPGYSIRDVEKLKQLAAEYGIDAAGLSNEVIAQRLAEGMMEDYGMKKEKITLINRAPKQRIELWEKLKVIPRGIDRETSETMHRTHMGVDNDYVSFCMPSETVLRTATADL